MTAAIDPFEDVLRAFAADMGEELEVEVSAEDLDAIYWRALDEGIVTQKQLDASFDKLLETRVLEPDAHRMVLDPVDELCRVVAAAGATMTLDGHPISPTELRLEVADRGMKRLRKVMVPGYVVAPSFDVSCEVVATMSPEVMQEIRDARTVVWTDPEGVQHETIVGTISPGVEMTVTMEPVAPRPRWTNMDGQIHVTGECCDTGPMSGKACHKCGALVHQMPVYGGIMEICEKCPSDAECWHEGKPPAPCGDFV